MSRGDVGYGQAIGQGAAVKMMAEQQCTGRIRGNNIFGDANGSAQWHAQEAAHLARSQQIYNSPFVEHEREYAAKEQQIAPEPIRDIQRQMGCLRKEVEALQSSIHDLLVRLDPVLEPENKGQAGEGLPQASTPLGQQLQEVESVVYHTRLAVLNTLERIQLP